MCPSLALFRIEVPALNGPVYMPSDDRVSIGRGSDRDYGRFRECRKDALCAVSLLFGVGTVDVATLCCTVVKLVVTPVRPDHTGDDEAVRELVTDGLLVLPLEPDPVDVDDVVRLEDGEAG